MSRRSPATVRNLDVANVLAEKERLASCPTVRVHVEVIRALIEADEERAQSETLRVATAVAESVQDPCEVCGIANAGETDPRGEVQWVCEPCWHERNEAFCVPSAWDSKWDSGKADR